MRDGSTIGARNTRVTLLQPRYQDRADNVNWLPARKINVCFYFTDFNARLEQAFDRQNGQKADPYTPQQT
jgi:hypothetical protein